MGSGPAVRVAVIYSTTNTFIKYPSAPMPVDGLLVQTHTTSESDVSRKPVLNEIGQSIGQSRAVGCDCGWGRQDVQTTKATIGKLYCLDLAASNRKPIDMSLSAFGNCISALADASAGKSSSFRFRDSRLTRLLRDSLGGNSKTSLVITIGAPLAAVLATLYNSQHARIGVESGLAAA